MKNANEANTANKNMENNCNKINESAICENIIKSKDIICQKCAENVFLNIKDYRIKLYECKNNHIIENILINEFEKFFDVDTSKITCQNCNKNDRSKTNNNDFYICLTCKKNLCPECKIFHDKKHKIIKYDLKNYICPEHNMHYIRYCNQCKENICLKCEKSHKNHKNLIYFGEILVNDDDFSTEMNEFDDYINKFNGQIKDIIQKLEIVKKNFEIYSKLVKHIYNNYDCENINYQKIQNIKEIKNFNEIIKNDIKIIIKDENIKNKFNNIIEIYNKMNNKKIPNLKQKHLIEKINEIKILSKVKEDSIDHRKKEKNKNIVSHIYSVKIIGKIKEGNKIVSENKLEILAGKNDKDNISKKKIIETNPRYLKNQDEIFLRHDELFVLFFLSKKDNNPYLVTYYYTKWKYNYNIYKIDLESKLTNKLTSLSLNHDIHYGLNYYFNDKNYYNEYLMVSVNSANENFVGIIIIDITNNYNINYKINLFENTNEYAMRESLLVFPQNNNNNYIIFVCKYKESLHNKLYSFDGKFIKNINTFPLDSQNTLISWYNRKDKNNYIIQNNSEGTIIFNLFEDIYDVLTSSFLANNNIYKINDLDCVLCINKRDYGIIEIWNLYSKRLFKTIKINTKYGFFNRYMIPWNEKYLIYSGDNGGTIGILDIENEITSQMSLKRNQSSEESLPNIIGFKKRIAPKQGESLIVISQISDKKNYKTNYLITLMSIN